MNPIVQLLKIKNKHMENVTVSKDGKHWEQAKQEPYYPSVISNLLCALGFHEHQISKKYRGTLTCFKCGKRKVGLSHY